MILLMNDEVKKLQKLNLNRNLSKTTNHRYLRNDDYKAMKVVCKMRGYDNLEDFYWKVVESTRHV